MIASGSIALGGRFLFLRSEHALVEGGGASARSLARPSLSLPAPDRIARWRETLADIELVPDLGSRIGTRTWWRGAATCAGLCAVTFALAPGFDMTLPDPLAATLTPTDREALASQSIAPIAYGATTGRRIGATEAVEVLADTPERPTLELSATLGGGNGLRRALERSGVGRHEAEVVAQMVGEAVSVGDIASGTRLDITLGRRPTRDVPRPLERLAFRARFDLALEVARGESGLALRRLPIAIDNTPLRVRGRVGRSLYRSARASGVPAKSVEAFIKTISAKLPMSRIGADDEYDLIVEQARAETGEVQTGKLLYAAVRQGARETRMVRWESGAKTLWYDANGVGERRGMMQMPVAARISSTFGWRRHPVLGFRRMHKGLDFAASHGTPIRAATDGVVGFAGRNGGYGNYVRLNHAAGLATAYGHMSRIAVRSGARVSRGDVIGYVGSTGLSTGPHLHYEMWRGGTPVNPMSASFSTVDRLGGQDLARFRSQLSGLMATPVGGARKAAASTDMLAE